MKKVIAILAYVMFCINSIAGESIGNVIDLYGTVVIKRNNIQISLSKNSDIEINDKIETKNGSVKIKFKDDTTVTVTESSSLLIDDFVYDPKSKSGKLGIKAVSGTMRYVSGNIAHNNPNSVKINTPTAAIAVRGTDFISSVDETGGSMIILMPSCEVEGNVNLKGLTCGSGRIDVDSGGTVVTLDRPYQATLVETAGQPPSPPVVVNLNGTAIGNGLMLSPPTTGSGASVVAAARSATEKTGDSTPASTAERQQTTATQSAEAQAQRQDTERAAAVALELTNKIVVAGVKVTNVSDNPYIYKTWRDSSATQQVGWGFEKLSSSGLNYVNMALSIDTKALIVVTQDYLTEAYNSNTQSSKSYGTIIVNQSYR